MNRNSNSGEKKIVKIQKKNLNRLIEFEKKPLDQELKIVVTYPIESPINNKFSSRSLGMLGHIRTMEGNLA